MMKDKHGCLTVLFSYLAIPVVVAILVFAYFGAVDTFNGRRDARKAAEKAAADEEHWDIYNAGLVDEGDEKYSEDYCKGITQDTTVALIAVLLLAITMNIQLDMKMV